MALKSEIRGDVLVIRAEQARIDAAGAIRFKEAMRDVAAGAGTAGDPRPVTGEFPRFLGPWRRRRRDEACWPRRGGWNWQA
jgi:hypothetical protein